MARSKDSKKQLVEQYLEKLKDVQAVYIIEQKNLKANQATELKKQLFDLDSSFNVVKNSLLKISLEKSGLPVPKELADRSHAVVFSSDKVSESAKVVKTFIDANEGTLEIKSGIFNGKEISAQEIKDIADLPSREVMLGQVLGTMQAPISGFVTVLAGTIRNMVNVVNAIKEEKEKMA